MMALATFLQIKYLRGSMVVILILKLHQKNITTMMNDGF